MKLSRVSRDFFCSLVIAVERPLVNQLAYPYRPQRFVSSEALNEIFTRFT